MSPNYIYCRSCGAQISSTALFCRKCGFKTSSNYSIDYAIDLNNKATEYDIKGNHDLAIETYERALSIAEEEGDEEGIKKIVSNLLLSHINKSVKYSENENFDDAIDILNEALEKAEKYWVEDKIDKIKSNLSTIYNNKAMALPEDEYSEIIDNLDIAVAYAEDSGDKKGIKEIKSNLSTVYNNYALKLGKDGSHDMAIKYLEMALSLSKDIRDTKGTKLVNSNLASAYFARGMEGYKYGDSRKAVNNLEKSLDILFLLNMDEDEEQRNFIRQLLTQLYSDSNKKNQGTSQEQKNERRQSGHRPNSKKCPDTIKELLKEFELDQNETITIKEIKSQYYYWVEILHPDKNQNKSEKARKKAEEKLKRINQIYEELDKYYR